MSSNSKVADNQCPTCKAPLFFDAKSGKFKCEYCGGEFTIEDIEKSQVKKEDEQIDENYVTYNCPDCGAQVIADENTAATFCLYCGNANILKNRLSGKFAPSLIIPFKKTKEDAIAAFKNLEKGHPLMPRFFNKEEHIEKITGVYIPFWLFDINMSGTMFADAVRTKTWISGNTSYTKTDIYKVNRSAKMNFTQIPVDGSKKFADDIMNTIEPFDYNEFVPYNHAYLAGFFAEKYDVESNEAYGIAKNRACESANEVLYNSIVGYTSKTVKSKSFSDYNSKTDYVLLPVWMVNIKYKDKYYLFAMNGQTGEFVGNIPIDPGRTVKIGTILFFSVFIVIIVLSLVLHAFGI